MAVSKPRTDAEFVDRTRARIDAALADHLPGPSALAPRLVDAMRYAVLGGGKRLRPLLLCAAAASVAARATDESNPSLSSDAALVPACAIEYIHAYSLIHDDLPAMDDDALRHGRPTCHLAFDEPTAILAGDALQSLAFELLARHGNFPAQCRLDMIAVLADAAGWQGMAGGQARDMAATGAPLSQPELDAMHSAKTGALFQAAVRLGALAGGADAATQQSLMRFATSIGLAFQVVDDVLDVTADSAQLGKAAGADAGRGKNTYPGLIGVAASRDTAADLLAQALRELDTSGLAQSPLARIAVMVVERAY